ncbi:DUF2321 domain-containing protein [Halalkalibacter sp. APA_J-10(15)]|uniref:DUF2321 domain-containing protein n=1 Tax=Halalkalibacter sp. APA_J-10(15) TaxID=2933805 RepID=UPI001FF6EC07|nr:DUF2321 domain-containing protein [Halalkalibacter sp. APA_J-10(15)]MCK0471423.1 DUF2321 domain-containing protein [Halalkalibacter sp. APA_J-10(15)]
MGYYQNATICINGHVASRDTSNYRKFCKECGQKTISLCQNCHTNIQGEYDTPGVAMIGFSYDPPSFCHECGNPYPWISQIIDNAIELLALDDELPDEHKEIIKGAFPDLIVETPATPVAVAKYKKYMPKAAEYVQNGVKKILYDVASQVVKKSIWG